MKAEEKEGDGKSRLENIKNEGSKINPPLRRPKRNIMQKNFEYNNGLLWREEKDLKRALYASLQENKKNGNAETNSASSVTCKRIKKLRNRHLRDDSANCSPKRTKVHAQRKFAQGSNPNSPAPTPVKFRNNSSCAHDLLPSQRPKTEDFLTFLCLRGTSVLPPALDFFNIATKSDLICDSRCHSPITFDVSEKQKSCFRHNTHQKSSNKNGKLHKTSRNGIKLKDVENVVHHVEKVLDLKTEKLKDHGSDAKKYADFHSMSESSPEKEVCSVQALKQKYKQQRLVKQQKALAKAKKMLDANLGSKKDKNKSKKDSKLDDDDQKIHKEQKDSKKKNLTSEMSDSECSSLLLARKSDSKRPVTRNSNMMTRSAKEEMDRAAFEASKRASEDNAGKREKRKNSSKVVELRRSLRESRPRRHFIGLSDFSSGDDEPLLKKAKSSRASTPSGASDDSWSVGPNKKRSTTSKKAEGKGKARCLRSRKKDKKNTSVRKTVEEEEEKPIERTATGRPSRKTKEAATVYLELLGKKLMSHDLFDDEDEEEDDDDDDEDDVVIEKMRKSKPKNKNVKEKNIKVEKKSIPPPKRSTRGRRVQREIEWKETSTSESDLSSSSSDSDSSSDYKYRKPVQISLRKKEKTEVKKKKVQVPKSQVKKEVIASTKQNANSVRKATKLIKPSPVAKTTKTTVNENIRYEIPLGLDDHCNYTKKPPIFMCKPVDAKNIKESKRKTVNDKRKILPIKQEDQDKGGSRSIADSSDSISEILNDSCSEMPELDDGSVHIGESTSIAVKDNITSNSVAIQVNLVDDMSDFEDEMIDFNGSEFGSESSLSLERILTPSYFSEGFTGSPRGRLDLLLCPSNQTTDSPKTAKSTRSSDGSLPNKCPSPNVVVPTMPKSKAKAPASKQETIKAEAVQVKRRGRPPGSTKNAKTEPVQPKQVINTPAVDETEVPLLEAPTFTPTEEEFQDPIEYFEKIRAEGEKYGICRIIPPAPFKPECKINDDMRFSAHNQYIHKMFHRNGPNVLTMASIRRHLESQGGNLDQVPLIGGMELDLPKLYQTVEKHGGIKEVIEKKKWQKIADAMKIPKSAQDRITKLYDAYCKYLLSYSMLTKDERQKLEHQVHLERQRKKNKGHSDIDDCVTKGRSMSLSCFYRIARNTMSMWFKQEPQPEEVENEYWKLVTEKQDHTCVHAGNIDSSVYGYGFTSNKNSTFSRHPWNLKVLTNNSGTVLRSMGPIMGVTIPTLHVGMLFTTGCWYRDPHCLPWIEYLHAGASKIWYGVPASQSLEFRNAMKKVVPEYVTNNPIWLASDTAMVPPSQLIANGASLCRVKQDSGQFVLVFPRAFTSTICCGYTVSESVYFAHREWLENAEDAFNEIRASCEPPVFSLERLLFCIALDNRSQLEVLQVIQPVMEQIRQNELTLRKTLHDLGLKTSEHLPNSDARDVKRRRTRSPEEEEEYECDVCRANCYVSMVVNADEDIVYCLKHAIEHFQKKKRDLKYFKLLYSYDQVELKELVEKLDDKLGTHSQKKSNKKSPKKK
uniref:Protein Jumonji n=1 Tax=Strigamia maritima TaxID=126957 RepID=T1J0L9_STRMM